jgi:hypothetical protein
VAIRYGNEQSDQSESRVSTSVWKALGGWTGNRENEI